MECADDAALWKDRRRLLGSRALVDRQCERTLLIEAEGVHAVDHHLAGKRARECCEQLTVTIPRNGDNDDVCSCCALLVARSRYSVANLIGRGLSSSGIARTESDRMAGHR